MLALLVRGVLYLRWLWRYGDGNAKIRQDMDELDWDDAAALGRELYLAIISAADKQGLQALSPEAHTPPAIGAVLTRQGSPRKRRI